MQQLLVIPVIIITIIIIKIKIITTLIIIPQFELMCGQIEHASIRFLHFHFGRQKYGRRVEAVGEFENVEQGEQTFVEVRNDGQLVAGAAQTLQTQLGRWGHLNNNWF